MNKTQLRLIKLALVTSLSSISARVESEIYKDYNRKPSVNLVIEDNRDMGFGEFPIQAYEYDMIRQFQKEKTFEELEPIVEMYASIFCIDKHSVFEIIKSKTNNYESDDFVWNKNILGTNEKYEDFKSQVFFLTYDIFKNPNNYSDHEIKRCYDIEPQIGDMTIREFVYEISDILDVDGDLALAIACLESGYFKYTYHNDSFGTGCSHNNIYQGIIYGIYNLKYNYINYGLTTPESIVTKYCPSSVESWPSQVKSIKYNLKNGYRLYDEYDKELIYYNN